MSAIELVEKSQLTERPSMKSGDTVEVEIEKIGVLQNSIADEQTSK